MARRFKDITSAVLIDQGGHGHEQHGRPKYIAHHRQFTA
jgi:hypothetical protein